MKSSRKPARSTEEQGPLERCSEALVLWEDMEYPSLFRHAMIVKVALLTEEHERVTIPTALRQSSQQV